MGVDVADRGRAQARAIQRVLHTACGSLPSCCWLSHVMRIPTHTVSREFCINSCPSGSCVLSRFQDQCSSPLSHDKTVPSLVPRTARCLRGIVAPT